MDHMLVLSFLAIVLVGTWSAFVTRQLYGARGIPQLRDLFYYVVCFNAMVFGYLVAKYAFTNLLGDDPTRYPDSLMAATALPVYVIHVGVAWTAVRLAGGLRRQPLTPIAGWLFAAGVALFGLSYAVGITLVLKDSAWTWLLRTHAALCTMMTIVIVVVFSGLVFGRHRQLVEDQKKSVRRLGWYLLCGHLVLAGSIALSGSAHLIAAAAALLWLNCVPLIWLRGGFRLYHRAPTKEDGETISSLAQEYDITQREREVMELIVQGKSNKEIEDQLCISFSTVKNHVYNLYRKLNVNSRTQLMHMFMTSAPHAGDLSYNNGHPSTRWKQK
jgi:DNA-binding CsgD family transcriptional regulator